MIFLREKAYFFYLILFSALIFFAGLGSRHLWNPDEPRVAGIAAEMAITGNRIVPMLNGKPFLEKPPLYFWTSSSIFNFLKTNTYTARIPSALAAVSGVMLIFILARSMGFSPLSALLCGFVLATSAEYWSLGRRCIIDMMLCFFTTGAMVSFHQAASSGSQRKFLWRIGFVASLSCALLTKGLVGIAIPVSALSVWLLIDKRHNLKSWMSLLAGSAICFIPFAIWLWLLYNKLGWDAFYEVLWINNFGRFAGSHNSHIAPFYYYIINAPEQFLPWTLFLPFAFVYHIREMRKKPKQNSSLFFMTWLAIPFLLLSVSAGKRGIYLLPLYPAAALLVGTSIGQFIEKKTTFKKLIVIPSYLLLWIIIAVSVGLCGTGLYFKQPFLICIAISVPSFFLSVWAYTQLKKKNFSGFFKITMAALVVLFISFDTGITPIFNQFRSYEPLFNYCRKLTSEGTEIRLFRPKERYRGAAVFYLGRTVPVIKNKEVLTRFLESGNNLTVICSEKEIKGRNNIHIVKKFNIGHRAIAIVKTRTFDQNT